MSGAKFDEMTPWPVAAVPRYDYAVLRPSASLDLGALTRFLEEKRIARFKLPERLEVIESLPATAVGKI
jgi:2,3-dihydroxybenzoate---[aryl-carrier protein] ligase